MQSGVEGRVRMYQEEDYPWRRRVCDSRGLVSGWSPQPLNCHFSLPHPLVPPLLQGCEQTLNWCSKAIGLCTANVVYRHGRTSHRV